jgi:hypothetical protein
MSALRRAQWPVKYEAIRSAFVRDGVNPATGRKCKLHKCSACGELFPAKDMRADHIDPIVPVTGFDNWDALIARLFCETRMASRLSAWSAIQSRPRPRMQSERRTNR